jgi:hypothetical protein
MTYPTQTEATADSEAPDRDLLIPIPMYDDERGEHNVLLRPEWLQELRPYRSPNLHHEWDFAPEHNSGVEACLEYYPRKYSLPLGTFAWLWVAEDVNHNALRPDFDVKHWRKAEEGYVLRGYRTEPETSITKVTQTRVFYGPDFNR